MNPATDTDFIRELAVLKRARILFGHQSVGQNILDGLAALLTAAGDAAAGGPRIRTWDGKSPDSGSGIVSAFIGENTHPESKCRAMETLFAQPGVQAFDVALMKFCFVDFGGDTDPAALLAAYRETIAGLKARHPGTVFVHVTAPLTAISLRDKLTAPIKHLLGRPRPEASNIRRNAYNRMLRQAFPGEPLFDIARLESLRPDGTRAAFRDGDAELDCLAGEYASDGAHLNAEGSRRLARGLVTTLAAAMASSRAVSARAASPPSEASGSAPAGPVATP
ncbi:MAG: SGNH/GDSL hydrolase family protein [Fibrobacteria bacterium]